MSGEKNRECADCLRFNRREAAEARKITKGKRCLTAAVDQDE